MARQYLILNCCILLLVVAVLGCRSAIERHNIEAKKFNKERNEIYSKYLTADVPGARQDLLALAELGENETNLGLKVQASHLLRSYSWLYAFESRAGNPELANVYFEKAKYWKIREKELDGLSDLEIGQMLPRFTGEMLISNIDDWDQGESDGKGPYYLQQLKAEKK